MLKKVLHYNNVSKELLASVPKLQKGKPARFRSSVIAPDSNNPRRFRGPSIDNILTKDTIWDPHQERFVEIAYCDQTANNKGESFAVFKTITFRAPLGEITCHAGVADEEYLYYFLMLSNQNSNKEDRDVTKPIKYYVVDEEKNAKEKRKERNKKLDALTKATSLSPDEIRDFIAATGGNDKDELEILREKVESWADSKPEEFLKLVSDVNANLKATVKRALDKGVITFDKEQLQFSWGNSGEKILSVSRSQGTDHLKEFVETVMTDKRYDKVIPSIRTALKK
jgi:hypothetical protein